MARKRELDPAELVTIRTAAELLGVSLPTLRRWDASRRFRARRHPINGYRLYAKTDVMKLRRKIINGKAA